MLATFIVNDPGDFIDTNPSITTLREAIDEANADDTDPIDLITFNLPDDSTIDLTVGELVISDSVTIDTEGKTITIDAGKGASDAVLGDGFRAFRVNNGDVKFMGLTITGGDTSDSNGGGAIFASAGTDSLTLEQVTVRDNFAPEGGGLSLRLEDDTAVLVTDSLFELNNAADDGGGIRSSMTENASLKLQNSVLTGNEAGSDGGGLSFTAYGGNFGDPTFPEPRALTVTQSVVSGNTTGDRGGGIYTHNFRGTETLIEETHITGNTQAGGSGDETGHGGGVYAYFTGDQNINALERPRITISHSSVDNNDAEKEGGGIFVCFKYNGDFVAQNTTISGNRTSDVANGKGGGIFVGLTPIRREGDEQGHDVHLQNTTVTENKSTSGGGLEIEDEDGLIVKFTNSILSGNTNHQMQPSNVVGRIDIANTIFNLIGTGSDIRDLANMPPTLDASNEITDAPLLSSLGMHGGLTPTHKPQDDSPAVDKGQPGASTLDYDQRGADFTRIVGGRIDIGAVELRSAPYVLNVILSDSNDPSFEFDFTEQGVIGTGAQIRQIEHSGINTVTIVFSEQIDLPPAIMDPAQGLRLLAGTDGTDFALNTPTVNGNNVTWVLSGGVSLPDTEFVLLNLSDDIKEMSGLKKLDGEWINPKTTATLNPLVSKFPSGDGIAGGNFNFAFTTYVPGDFDGNNSVGNGDLTLLLSNWGVNIAENGIPDGWITNLPTTSAIGNDQLTQLLTNWGIGWDEFLLYGDVTDDAVIMSVDQVVDMIDINAWMDHYMTGLTDAKRSEGDVNNDGLVEMDDLMIIMDAMGMPDINFV